MTGEKGETVAGGSDTAGHGFTFTRRFAGHGFTPASRSAEHGFTLIELMVVIAIMALATGAVMLAIPDAHGSLRGEAERFAARVRAAQDAAILQARPVALVAATDGYRFETRSGGRWMPVTTSPLESARWEEGTRAQIAGIERGAEGQRALFDPTGLSDPLDVTLVRGKARVAVHVGAGGTIDVTG